ncbi:MAG: hypothetical protein PVF83_14565 [Anaerolineales bacterium]|jgi:hypothetical protein
MVEALRFFQEYETIIYFILGTGVIVYGWRFWTTWQQMRSSIYELEQINAQRRLNQSAITIFIFLVMGFVVFSLVTFVTPVVTPEFVLEDSSSFPTVDINVPTDDLFTSTPEVTDSVTLLATATPLPTVVIVPGNCIPDKINITSPRPNEEVSGVITVEGVVNVEDFGFYKFELAPAYEEIWKPIQVFKTLVKEEGPLYEDWDTSIWPPGAYVIQIVVTQSDGTAYLPCRIPIQIGRTP